MLEAIQIALLLASASLAPALGPRPASQPPNHSEVKFVLKGDEAVVRISTERGQTDVEVYFGERGPYRFQIDTYATYEVCIDDDLARELGLKTLRRSTNGDGFTTRSVDIVAVDELSLPGIQFRGLQALVDDYDSIPARGGSLQGILGFPLFRDLLLTMDYPGQRVVLRVGELGAGEPGVISMILNGGAPDVDLIVGGKRLRFGLDTGADLALRLLKSDLESMPHFGEAPVIGKARTVYSEVNIRGAFLEQEVQLAGLDFDAVYGFFSESNGRTMRLIGQRLLRDCRLTFDQRTRRLQVTREARPAEVQLSAERLKRWVGVYSNASRSLNITLKGDRLRVLFRGGPQLEARTVDGDRLVFASSAMRLQWVEDSEHGRGLRVLQSADLSSDWFAAAEH